jgi:hypothetical protein
MFALPNTVIQVDQIVRVLLQKASTVVKNFQSLRMKNLLSDQD